MELLNHFVQSLLMTDEIFSVGNPTELLSPPLLRQLQAILRTSMSKKFGINVNYTLLVRIQTLA